VFVEVVEVFHELMAEMVHVISWFGTEGSTTGTLLPKKGMTYRRVVYSKPKICIFRKVERARYRGHH
jgi:hypothetical protein